MTRPALRSSPRWAAALGEPVHEHIHDADRREDPASTTAEDAGEGPGLSPWSLLALASAAVVGTSLLVGAFVSAAQHRNGAHFPLFWSGMLLVTVTVVACLAGRRASGMQRVLLVVGLAAYTTLPKLLRTPDGPLFSDELAHWRQTADIVTTGVLGEPNSMLRAVGAFPGMHAVTATVSSLTGLDAWTAAMVVIVGARVLVLLAVLWLVREVTGSLRVGALAAALYTTNSSWLFFDAQYAYETVALPLAFFCLGLAARAVGHPGPQRRASVAAASVLAGAVAVVHHLSALVLLAVLLLVAVMVSIRNRRGHPANESTATAWGVAALVGLPIAGWMWREADLLAMYLSPSLTRSAQQLSALITRILGNTAPVEGHAATPHRLFAGTVLPPYEVLAALTVPFALLAVVIVAWRRGRLIPPSGTAAALAILGLSYFGSLPFLLTAGGTEGARRTWAWSFVGLSMVVSLLVTAVARQWHTWRPLRRRAAAAALAAVFVVVSVGNVAGGQNEAYRFPGPYAVGSDTRSFDAELRDAAVWMRQHVGPGNWTVADRFARLAFGSLGRQEIAAPSHGFAVWDLYFSEDPPSAPLRDQLRTPKHYTYLVVDSRMAEVRPELGYWFTVDEPGRGSDQPAPSSALSRFNCLPWTTPVYASTHLTIYRLDLDAYNHSDTLAAARSCR